MVFVILFLPALAFALEIKSDAFKDGGRMPSQYACDERDISPPLAWSDVPAGTKSFALICDDPDAPSKSWSHWVVFNIPPDKTGLPENFPKVGISDDGTNQGINDFGKVGYGGPCPPPDGPHRYFFKLYALDTTLMLDENSTKDAVQEAINGHIIAETKISCVYDR